MSIFLMVSRIGLGPKCRSGLALQGLLLKAPAIVACADVLPLTASTNPGSPLGLQISHGDSFHDEWIEDIAWQVPAQGSAPENVACDGPVSASVDNEIGVPAYWLPRHLRASAPALTHDLAKSTPCELPVSIGIATEREASLGGETLPTYLSRLTQTKSSVKDALPCSVKADDDSEWESVGHESVKPLGCHASKKPSRKQSWDVILSSPIQPRRHPKRIQYGFQLEGEPEVDVEALHQKRKNRRACEKDLKERRKAYRELEIHRLRRVDERYDDEIKYHGYMAGVEAEVLHQIILRGFHKQHYGRKDSNEIQQMANDFHSLITDPARRFSNEAYEARLNAPFMFTQQERWYLYHQDRREGPRLFDELSATPPFPAVNIAAELSALHKRYLESKQARTKSAALKVANDKAVKAPQMTRTTASRGTPRRI